MHGPLRLRHGSYHLYLSDVLISCPDERDPFGKHLSSFVCLGSLTLSVVGSCQDQITLLPEAEEILRGRA